MTTAEFSLEFSLDDYEGALKLQPAWLVTDCKSLYHAIHKEGDQRLAIELATVKSQATEAKQTWSGSTHGTRLRESLKRYCNR